MVVIDGQGKQEAHKLILHAEVQAGGPEPVGAAARVQPKHAKVLVKELPHQQLEELLQGHASQHYFTHKSGRFGFCRFKQDKICNQCENRGCSDASESMRRSGTCSLRYASYII